MISNDYTVIFNYISLISWSPSNASVVRLNFPSDSLNFGWTINKIGDHQPLFHNNFNRYCIPKKALGHISDLQYTVCPSPSYWLLAGTTSMG